MFRRAQAVSVSLLFAAAASPANAAPDYKFVLADEYVRNYFGTARLAPDTGINGGIFTTPNSLAGDRVTQNFVTAAGTYEFPENKWAWGMFQPLIHANLGGMFYDERLPEPANGSAGDKTDGLSVAANVTAGIRWRPWHRTTLAVHLGYGYMYAENNYTANTPESQAAAAIADGSSRNWSANVLNSSTELSAAQSLPFSPDAWGDSEDAPASARIRFKTSFANVKNIGIHGTRNDQRRFVNSYFWTNGIELFLPVIEIGGAQLFAEPFIRRTDMFDDGHNAIAGDSHFYEAGARIGCNAVALSGSAFWGDDFSGWQASLTFRF